MRTINQINSIEAYEADFYEFMAKRPLLHEKYRFKTISVAFYNSYIYVYPYLGRGDSNIRVCGIFDGEANEKLKSLGFKKVDKTEQEQFVLDYEFKKLCNIGQQSIIKLFSRVLGVKTKLVYSNKVNDFVLTLDI